MALQERKNFCAEYTGPVAVEPQQTAYFWQEMQGYWASPRNQRKNENVAR